MHFTYIEGGEIISDIKDFLDGAGHSVQDPINDMHHTVCGHLVTMDDPGTVHCHNLHRDSQIFIKPSPSLGSEVLYRHKSIMYSCNIVHFYTVHTLTPFE